MNVFRSVIESKIGFQFLVAKFDDDKKVYDLTVYDIDEDGTVGNPFPFDMHDLPDLVESVETRLKQSWQTHPLYGEPYPLAGVGSISNSFL